jgi:hypothetical protein
MGMRVSEFLACVCIDGRSQRRRREILYIDAVRNALAWLGVTFFGPHTYNILMERIFETRLVFCVKANLRS